MQKAGGAHSTKRGPSKKPESERRTIQVGVCLTPGEADKLDQLRGDESRAAWLRTTALGGRHAEGRSSPSAVARETWKRVARLQDSLALLGHHLVEHVDYFGRAEDVREIKARIGALQDEATALRSELLGQDRKRPGADSCEGESSAQ